MTLNDVEIHRNWLLEKPRDLELQSFVEAEILNGDWAPLAERTKSCSTVIRAASAFMARSGASSSRRRIRISAPSSPSASCRPSTSAPRSARTQMVIHSPYTSWSYNNLDNNKGEREKIIEYTHLTLKDAVKRAEDIGLTMVIENIDGQGSPYPASGLPTASIRPLLPFRSTPAMPSTHTARAPAHRRSTTTSTRPATACAAHSSAGCRRLRRPPLEPSAKVTSTGAPSSPLLPKLESNPTPDHRDQGQVEDPGIGRLSGLAWH